MPSPWAGSTGGAGTCLPGLPGAHWQLGWQGAGVGDRPGLAEGVSWLHCFSLRSSLRRLPECFGPTLQPACGWAGEVGLHRDEKCTRRGVKNGNGKGALAASVQLIKTRNTSWLETC